MPSAGSLTSPPTPDPSQSAWNGRSVGTRAGSWGKAPTLSDSDHVEAKWALRKASKTLNGWAKQPCRGNLADYDRAFGIVLDDGQVA